MEPRTRTNRQTGWCKCRQTSIKRKSHKIGSLFIPLAGTWTHHFIVSYKLFWFLITNNNPRTHRRGHFLQPVRFLVTEPEQYSYPQASHTGIVLLNPNSAGHQNVACVLGAYCSNYTTCIVQVHGLIKIVKNTTLLK